MTKRGAKRGATRRKHTAVGKTRRKKKAVRWTANTGTIFHAANTEPTGRIWRTWRYADTPLDEGHFRKPVAKGSSRAIIAPWINSTSYFRGSMARNYPSRAWTRSVTRYPRSAAREALNRGLMLAEQEARGNGLGAIVQLNHPEEDAEYFALARQVAQGGASDETKARFMELHAKRSDD